MHRRLALAILAPALAGAPLYARAAGTLPKPAIEVTAEARVETPPDLALLDFGVVAQAETAAAASAENAKERKRCFRPRARSPDKTRASVPATMRSAPFTRSSVSRIAAHHGL